MTSNKKRKTDVLLEQEEPMLGTTPRRVVTANRQSLGAKLQNPQFLQLKETLYKTAHQELLTSPANARLLGGQSPRLPDATGEQHPAFAPEALVSLRWELADLRDTYQRPTGDVIAMGQEDAGQLGLVKWIDKQKDNGFPPTLLQDLRQTVCQVAAGGMHSAALKQDGRAYTWGCGDDGALGRTWSNEGEEEKYTTTPTQVTKLIPSKQAVSPHAVHSPENECNEVMAIAAGTSHTLFLTVSGNVYSSGTYKDLDSGHFSDVRPSGDLGQCKEKKQDVRDSCEGYNLEPVHIWQMPGRVRSIAAGGGFNAALLADQTTLVTWGMGHSGELARSADMAGGLTDEATGEPELGHALYRQLTTLPDGTEKKKYLEDIIKEHFLKPKPVHWSGGGLANQRIVTHVACGGNHLLVAARAPQDNSSRLYTSGLNNYGKLGHGDEKARHELCLVEHLKDVPIARVAGGLDHSLILNAKGDTIYACGRGGYGQLGIAKEQLKTKAGSKTLSELDASKLEGYADVPLPVAFPTTDKLDQIGRFTDVACGEYHSMAITSGGKIYSWGYGEYGQAGNDPTISELDIEQPRLNEDWLNNETQLFAHHVSAGSQHSLLVASRYKPSSQS